MSKTINWSHKTLDELEQHYWNEIAPVLRRDGYDPHTCPPFQTLADHGYSGLAYTLREHHNLTPKEFLTDVVGLEDPNGGSSGGYDWQIDHEQTRNELQSYVRVLDRRQGLAKSTIATKRTHLATYARAYRDLHGEADLLGDLRDPDARPEETDRAYAVLDVLDDDLSTDGSKLEYLGTVSDWHDRLLARGLATYNPLEHAEREFRWERDDPDNHPLEADDVRVLYDAADSLADRLLVVALAGWGLRSGEVARLHQSQVVGLGSDDPHLAFDERKNGPGTVSLLYGVDILADRLDVLVDREGWNGYLFPSCQSENGHISSETVRRRFGSLVAETDVTVVGEEPTPHAARRFWYTTYRDSVSNLLEQLEGVAADQGSSSPEVIAKNYLSEDEIRHARRDAMGKALAEAFGSGGE